MPSPNFPQGWDIWHTENRWSNEETMRRYIQRIAIPFIARKRKILMLKPDHFALALFDGFKGQTTNSISQLFHDNHISFVLIPANCTDKLQPLDLSINKPLKDA